MADGGNEITSQAHGGAGQAAKDHQQAHPGPRPAADQAPLRVYLRFGVNFTAELAEKPIY